jgi:quercetin dioxygenase-like cupin family protein
MSRARAGGIVAAMSTTTPHPTAAQRRIEIADGTEAITFLETAAETAGARTTVEVELAAGSGNPLHAHRTYAETFEPLEGTLLVELDGRTLRLGPGERAVAPIGAVHRFAAPEDGPVRFRCTLEPASRGFEEMQQVGAGLAAEGRTRGHLPKDPRHLGLLMAWGDVVLAAGPPRLFAPVLRLAAALGRARGEDRRLRERYVRW